ncbi:MAG: 1-acyl-sn-glycerol-3-phosphate acyltransferase [Arenimonas sp.]
MDLRPEPVAALFAPARGVRALADAVVIDDPGRIAPGAARFVRRVVEPLVRWCFRPTLAGSENLPTQGAYLLVANHSGGMGLAELACFLVLCLRTVGPDRPMAGFALPLGFRVFPLSLVLRLLGAIPATYTAAERTLGAGVPILVFPGGDHESLRPIWQANRVDFGGRVGFLRIAARAGVPIVPLGIRGSHFTAPIVLRSKALAYLLGVPRLIGLKRWALSVLGLAGAISIMTLVPLAWPARAALAWLWLGSPLVFLPWVPWTIRMRIGAPIPAEVLFGDCSGNEGAGELQDVLARVRTAVQAQVDAA